MSKTKTVKATAPTVTEKARELVGTILAGFNGVAGAVEALGKNLEQAGVYIDRTNPIFPLLNATGTWKTFAKNNGDTFTEAEWLRGMAFLSEIKTQYNDSGLSERGVEFKTVKQGISRQCKYYAGTKKSAPAVERAKQSKLENPEGKQPTKRAPKAKDTDEKVDILTATRQQFANVITCLNLLADAQGIAGLPTDANREQALQLVTQAQRLIQG